MEKYQSVRPRIYAGFIDATVFIFVNTLLSFLLSYFKHPMTYLIFTIISYLLTYIYSIALTARYGGTLGKMLFNVHVVDSKTEAKISLNQAIRRELLNIVTGLPHLLATFLALFPYSKEKLLAVALPDPSSIWFKVELAITLILLTSEIGTAIFNKKRRALHDFVAGTVIIRTSTYRPYSRIVAAGGLVLLFAILLSTGLSEKFDLMLKNLP